MRESRRNTPVDKDPEAGQHGRRAEELELDRVMDLDPQFERIQRGGIIAGLIGLVLTIAGLLLGNLSRFFQAYLVAYLFWSGISLGCLLIVLLHYLVGGGWGVMVRRIVEAASKTLWLVALSFIPIILGVRYLYPWANPGLVAADPVLQHKSLYLNIPFFIARAVVFFVLWVGLAWLLSRWAEQPEYFTDPLRRRNFQRLSAIGIILFVLTGTFASVDWVMSLEPGWFSTIFGFLIITGQALSGMAFALVFLPFLARRSPLVDFVTPGLFRDLGALLLTLVIFWAYISFSQYLIIWYGNIPREVTWYINRSNGGWRWTIILVSAVQFVLPFIALLSVRAKSNLRLLAGLSLAILAMRYIETFWLVMPSFNPERFNIHWVDFAPALALGGAWLLAFIWHLRRTPPALLTQYGIQESSDRGPEQTPA